MTTPAQRQDALERHCAALDEPRRAGAWRIIVPTGVSPFWAEPLGLGEALLTFKTKRAALRYLEDSAFFDTGIVEQCT